MIKIDQLANLESYLTGYNGNRFKVEKLAPYVFSIAPTESRTDEFEFGISALVHGDEVIGFYILEDFVISILEGQRRLDFPLLIVLANVDAALQGKRYLEYDLNRSFDKTSVDKLEFRRAQVLEPFIKRTKNWLDIHQCIYPTLESFFIFEYTPRSLDFAQALDEQLAIVSFKESFSKDGKTLMSCLHEDAYVTTIELGQKGFDISLRDHGLRILQKALQFIKEPKRKENPQNKIFTWGHVEPQVDGAKILVPDLKNFSLVNQGELLCTHGDKEVLSPVTGKILFPKYDEIAKQSAEICRLMVETNKESLES